jgi:zinc transport system permease protein
MIPSMFQYSFMIFAFIAGGVTAIIAPTMGIFLVTRRYSFMADTLSHVSLAGVALGYLSGTEPIIAAVVSAGAAALWVEALRRRRRVLGESALSMFLSGGLALAAVLLSLAHGANVNLSSVLFGSVATVTGNDVMLITILGAIVLGTIAILWKELTCIAFDEELAETGGIATRAINTLFVLLAAVTISVAMRTVGILLIGALMVIPVTTAMQIGTSFRSTMLLSIGAALLSVGCGLTAAYQLGISSGGAIVLVNIILFFLAYAYRSVRPA